MMGQELVRQVNEDAPTIDYECTDCQSLLIIFYDDDRPRYFCENCDQEVSARGLDDNHISDGIESNRGIF